MTQQSLTGEHGDMLPKTDTFQLTSPSPLAGAPIYEN